MLKAKRRCRTKRRARTTKKSVLGIGKPLGTKAKTTASSRHKLEKLLDIEWSKHIHSRDKVCQKCGGSGGLSAHHAFGRRHLATRWDVFNGTLLCYPHHIHWAHRDCGGYMDWFSKRVGTDQFSRLSEAHNSIVKHTTEDLENMLKGLRELNAEKAV